MRDCERCAQQLILTVTLPVPDQQPATIGLCANCDRDAGPAAQAAIAYHQRPQHDRDDRAFVELAVAWMYEVQRARGRVPRPRPAA